MTRKRHDDGAALRVLASTRSADSEIIEGEVMECVPGTQIALFSAPPMRGANGGEGVAVIEELLDTIRSKNTWRNYQGDFRDFFCVFLGGDANAKGFPDPRDVASFLRLPRREIALALNRYRASLLDRQLSESTVARRLAALKSLLKFAYRLEWCETDGRGLIDVERVEGYRDTAGIAPEITKKLLTWPAKRFGSGSVHALRDEALIRLASTNGLRRSSICRCEVGDFSYSETRLAILRKGKGTQKKAVRLPRRTADAIAAYLLAAGHLDDKGPLFRNLHRDPNIGGTRLTENGLWRIIKGYSPYVGVDLRPHLFRHGAITALSKATNGNLVEVQEFSGHAKVETVRLYIQNAQDTQGRMADLMDAMISDDPPKRRRKK